LDRNPKVASWVTNDHLGFGVHYIFQGERHRYRPDFIILLTNGIHLVLEIKGQDTEQARVKRGFLEDRINSEFLGFIVQINYASASPSLSKIDFKSENRGVIRPKSVKKMRINWKSNSHFFSGID
jgi:hypothetical protein